MSNTSNLYGIIYGLLIINTIVHVFQAIYLQRVQAKVSQVSGVFIIGCLNAIIAISPYFGGGIVMFLLVFAGPIFALILTFCFPLFMVLAAFKYSNSSIKLSRLILLLDFSIIALYIYTSLTQEAIRP